MSSRSLRILEMARKIVRSQTVQNENTCEDQFEKSKENIDVNNCPLLKEITLANTDGATNESFLEKMYEFDKDPTLPDFDSDDSVHDPNFVPSTLDSSVTSLDSTCKLFEMGKQIEKNLSNEPASLSLAETPKRKKCENFDSRKTIKEKRNTGKSYVNKSGKKIPERACVPLNINCRKQCKTNIPFSLQEKVFQNYWNLGTYDQRILYIGGLIEIASKKSVTVKKHELNPRTRNYHLKYYIPTKCESINVCQKCFKQCFNETESFLKSVVKKKLEQTLLEFCDHRGSNPSNNKIGNETEQKVVAHINPFPAYESHYTRRDRSCKYFQSDLNLSKLYTLYCEHEQGQKVSLTKYSQIFKTMNIKFKKPKADTCHKCDIMVAKIDRAKNDVELLQNLKEEQATHHLESDLAYKAKEYDKNLSKNDTSIKTFTFDLEQCLPTPLLQTSVSFYKRQLWTFNLTVYDCETNIPHCFMWHEGNAKRGGNEIASCVLKHLKSLDLGGHVKTVILYSDSCAGQNKNSFLSAMFTMFLKNSKHIECVHHKFLVPGHSHMECDVAHALIERKKKNTNVHIHHPRDWYNFIRGVGVKNKFNVIEMQSDDFMNFSSYLKAKFLWRNRNDNSEKFIWKHVKWLKYKKHYFGKIFYKTTLNFEDPFEVLNIRKRGINFGKIDDDIPKLPPFVPISIQKKKDLQDMLPLIDPCYHYFYNNLITEDLPETHPDLTEDPEEEPLQN